MPLLPSSRRQVLIDAGRSNVTPFVSAAVKIVPTQIVMNGSADFQIEIDNEERVEVGGASHPAKPEPHVPAGLPNTGESKPKANPKPDMPPGAPKKED